MELIPCVQQRRHPFVNLSDLTWNHEDSRHGEEREGLTGVSFEKCDNDRGENLTVRAKSSRHRFAYIVARYYVLPFRNPSIPRFVTETTSGSRRTTINSMPRDETHYIHVA